MNNITLIKLIVGITLFIIALISAIAIVPAGHRGVIVRLGSVQDRILDEGMHVKMPFIEQVVDMTVQTEKIQMVADAASKDLQSVNTTIALNYALDPATVNTTYQEFKREYQERVIVPSIEESVKSATAKFTAEELITKRPEVSIEMTETLKTALAPEGITVSKVNIVDFSFSGSFDEAIESKVTAEQEALAEKNRLEKVKFQAEQRIEEARGKAEAIRIEAEALQQNKDLLELRAIEKWNGILPQVTGDSVPFINLD